MSVLTNYIIPGNHGEIFGTNAMEETNLMEIKASLLELDGIEGALFNIGISHI